MTFNVNNQYDVTQVEGMELYDLQKLLKPGSLRCRAGFGWVREYIEFLISDLDKTEKVNNSSQDRKLELTEGGLSIELAELLIRGEVYDIHTSHIGRRY